MVKPSPEFEKLIDIEELRNILGGIPRKTLYKWSSEHRITGFPVYKLGRHLRFRRSEINDWLRKRCTTK